ncbi:MAG: DUF1697 domain-containing protein [Enhygromyxa sp.]
MPTARQNRHVALLRGINVGGKNRLAMATLRRMFEDAGAAEVQTYIQSGNVVFAAPSKLSAQIPKRVQQAIADELGLDIPLVLRSAAALAKIARAHPFAAEVKEPKLLMVAFLDRKPSAAKLASFDPGSRSPGDFVELRGQEAYLAFPKGSGRSKLDAAWLDRQLGVIGTWRNWLTVQKLAAMVE